MPPHNVPGVGYRGTRPTATLVLSQPFSPDETGGAMAAMLAAAGPPPPAPPGDRWFEFAVRCARPLPAVLALRPSMRLPPEEVF